MIIITIKLITASRIRNKQGPKPCSKYSKQRVTIIIIII